MALVRRCAEVRGPPVVLLLVRARPERAKQFVPGSSILKRRFTEPAEGMAQSSRLLKGVTASRSTFGRDATGVLGARQDRPAWIRIAKLYEARQPRRSSTKGCSRPRWCRGAGSSAF